MMNNQFNFETINRLFSAQSQQANPFNTLPPQPMEALDYRALIQQNRTLAGKLCNASAFIQALQIKKEMRPRSYRFDPVIGAWICQERNGRETTMFSFWVYSVLVINPKPDNTFVALKVDYSVDSTTILSITIPYKDFVTRKLRSYFKELKKYPDCQDKDANELLFNLIRDAKTVSFIEIPKHPGWNISEDGHAVFITGSLLDDYLADYFPESIKNRKIQHTNRSFSDVLAQYSATFPQDWRFKALLTIRISSLLLSIFSKCGIESEQIIALEPSEHVGSDMLTALTKTQNYTSFETNSLTDTRSKTKQKLENTYDGTILFRGSAFIDEKRATRPGSECLLEDIEQATGNEEHSKHQIIVIAKYARHQLPSSCLLRLSFDNVSEVYDAKELQRLSEEIDSTIIQYIANNYLLIEWQLKCLIKLFKKDFEKSIPSNKLNTFLILLSTVCLLKEFGYIHHDEAGDIISWLIVDNEYIDEAQVIVDDFSAIVNQSIRQDKFKIIEKNDYTVFAKDTNSIIYMGNNLCFEPQTIQKSILPQMSTTQNYDTLISSLDECGYLYATNKKRHPIPVFTPDGACTTLHANSISQNILDKDNKCKLNNLHNEEFFCEIPEIPLNEFLPLVVYTNGSAAGRQFHFQDAENNHMYVTGQSGYGKTYALSQLAAFLSCLEQRVIIFDSSSSFTYEALCRNLPQEFITSSITCHSIEENGIPVDLFSTEGCYNLPAKKNTVFKVVSAAAQELSIPQANVLKKALSEILKNNHKVSIQDMSDALVSNCPTDSTHTSLSARFESILEDIQTCGMSDNTWKQFFAQSRSIIIISTETADTETGNQLIDMLVASLYNYQHKENNVPLTIIIDEVQNQNLSSWSPISRILKEGRKDHITFIGASQKYYVKKNSTGDAMSKADTKIFLKPTPDSQDDVASELRYNSSKAKQFDRMERGDCIVKSNFYSKTHKRNCPAIISGKVCTFVPVSPSTISKDPPADKRYMNPNEFNN